MTKSFFIIQLSFFLFLFSFFFFLQNRSYSSSFHTFRFSNGIETAFESKCEFERDERQRLEYDTQFDDEHHHLENEHHALTNFPVTAA